MTTSPPPTLADLRREIDRIDEAMHRLLMERGDIIDTLIATKKTAESGSAFRPAREADIMKRLVRPKAHHGRTRIIRLAHMTLHVRFDADLSLDHRVSRQPRSTPRKPRSYRK